MSSRKGGKKGPKSQPQQPLKQNTPNEPLNPLLQLILDLLEQVIPKVVSNQSKVPSQQVILNCAKGVEKVFRQLIADSSSAPLLRYVIQLSTLIQQTTGLDGSSAKKITCYCFTFILDELRRHWDEYGLRQEEVHPDYRHAREDRQKSGKDTSTFKDISQTEYDSWCRAWNFLNT